MEERLVLMLAGSREAKKITVQYADSQFFIFASRHELEFSFGFLGLIRVPSPCRHSFFEKNEGLKKILLKTLDKCFNPIYLCMVIKTKKIIFLSLQKLATMKNFEKVAMAAFPNEPHMQDTIEPKWLALCIKSDLGVKKPSPESISVEFVSDGIVAVYVDGKKIGEYKPYMVEGKYQGHTIQ